MISFYIYNIYIRVSTVTTYSIVNVVSVDGVIRRISNLNKDEKKKKILPVTEIFWLWMQAKSIGVVLVSMLLT